MYSVIKKHKGKIILSLVLFLSLFVCCISAYFTSEDTKTNKFTVGEVSLKVTEENWTEPDNVVPRQTIAKDPKIQNDGTTEEYVFLEVVVPYADVETANDDGTKNTSACTELFSYTVNDGWQEFKEPVEDKIAGTVTHVYAYGSEAEMTALGAGNSTPALFNDVTFANVIEKQGLERKELDIVVNGYGIQTDGLFTASGNVTSDEVWGVLKNQITNEFILTEDNFYMAGISRGGDVVIPETFKYDGKHYRTVQLDESSFYLCIWLESVKIPDSVIRIMEAAFTHTGIKSITIPNGVTIIEWETFESCGTLSSVTLPENLTSIEGFAFAFCHSLPNITIPCDIKNIGEGAFNGCVSLTTINYCGTKEQWNAISKGDGWNNACPSDMQIICTDGILDKDGNPIS